MDVIKFVRINAVGLEGAVFAPSIMESPSGLINNYNQIELKQPQYTLSRLGSHAQGAGTQCLAGLKHQHVGAFFVHVGLGQIGGTITEYVDHAFGKILSGVNDVQVGGQGFGLCA